MAIHRIRRGLDLPITGQPEAAVSEGPQVSRVAVVAADFVGMKPRFLVKQGDTVKRGQPLLEDRKNPGVFFTAPGAGTVAAINRGEKRALQSVVVDLSPGETKGEPGTGELHSFQSHGAASGGDGKAIRELLLESGLWAAFRTRPFSKIPAVDSEPAAIFVTAMDTHPLAPPIDLCLEGRTEAFERGLAAVASLTTNPTYLCRSPGSKIGPGSSGVSVEEFSGAHPAGTPGVHIHWLKPVSRKRQVWHIGAQDVAAIGELLETGALPVARVISLAGPGAKKPRLLRTRMGASIDALVDGELGEGEVRVIDGSVLGGREARGDIHGYLGRYRTQLSCLREGREREFLGWVVPGFGRFSIIPTVMSRLIPGKRFAFTTSQNGEARPMVPIGTYERVMPMDIMPTFLLRALASRDLQRAEKLGALELDEEDLALCSFVCPGKTDWGKELRDNLTIIEKEG